MLYFSQVEFFGETRLMITKSNYFIEYEDGVLPVKHTIRAVVMNKMTHNNYTYFVAKNYDSPGQVLLLWEKDGSMFVWFPAFEHLFQMLSRANNSMVITRTLRYMANKINENKYEWKTDHMHGYVTSNLLDTELKFEIERRFAQDNGHMFPTSLVFSILKQIMISERRRYKGKNCAAAHRVVMAYIELVVLDMPIDIWRSKQKLLPPKRLSDKKPR